MNESNRLKILLKDCARGVYQQMYFWGKDVTHEKGNQLEKYGFKKSPSQGLRGTSCYTYESEGEVVELYGSCAGYYTDSSSLVFLRQRNRFYEWLPERRLVAGRWCQNDLDGCDTDEMFYYLMPFLQWWIGYEEWILECNGPEYRERCYREWCKVNSRLSWLDPESALRWIREFQIRGEGQVRPRHFN